jgi:hypothetical protein
MLVPWVVFPFHIMGKNDLDALLLQAPDPLKCLFGFRSVGMNTTYVAMDVVPLSNILLPAKNPPVMTRIAGEIYPLRPIITFVHVCKKVDVARKMAGSINNVNTAVLENIQHPRKYPECLPVTRKESVRWQSSSIALAKVKSAGLGLR